MFCESTEDKIRIRVLTRRYYQITFCDYEFTKSGSVKREERKTDALVSSYKVLPKKLVEIIKQQNYHSSIKDKTIPLGIPDEAKGTTPALNESEGKKYTVEALLEYILHGVVSAQLGEVDLRGNADQIVKKMLEKMKADNFMQVNGQLELVSSSKLLVPLRNEIYPEIMKMYFAAISDLQPKLDLKDTGSISEECKSELFPKNYNSYFT